MGVGGVEALYVCLCVLCSYCRTSFCRRGGERGCKGSIMFRKGLLRTIDEHELLVDVC